MKHLPAKAIFNDKLRNRLELKSGTDLLRAVAFATATCPTLKVDNDNEVYWGCGEAVSTTASCLFELIPSGFSSPTLRVGDEWKFVGMCHIRGTTCQRLSASATSGNLLECVPHSRHYVSLRVLQVKSQLIGASLSAIAKITLFLYNLVMFLFLC